MKAGSRGDSMAQKILIVEDDPNINNLLKEALEKEGYLCEQAFSGTEGDMLLGMKEYALVLLDLMLPGMDGEQVLGRPSGDRFDGQRQPG